MRHVKTLTAVLLMALSAPAFADIVTDWNAAPSMRFAPLGRRRQSPRARWPSCTCLSTTPSTASHEAPRHTSFEARCQPARPLRRPLPRRRTGCSITLFPDRSADFDALLATTLSTIRPVRNEPLVWPGVSSWPSQILAGGRTTARRRRSSSPAARLAPGCPRHRLRPVPAPAMGNGRPLRHDLERPFRPAGPPPLDSARGPRTITR